MNYKRKGHRGRGKRNPQDNQSCRAQGNSISKQAFYGRAKYAHTSASQRNRVEVID